MKYKFFFSILLISNLIVGQDYAWPTKTGKQLTSNFGEFRGDHFHMGLDIRTHASEGHPLYAVNDGYVYRIVTNFGGYGKALYLKTNDDKIVLYGHLTKYNKALENRLFELQNEKQSYFVNKYFNENECPVKRGEIIGYSGNSGGSMGPHLHFEFRNDIDQPLNPMTNGFPINDLLSPIFLDLAIIPLNSGTKIDESSLPSNYTPIKLFPNEYTLNDTILIQGEVGFSTRVIDKIQNFSYSYQIDRLVLYVDSIPTFSVKYNLLDYSERKYISTIYGQPSNNPKADDFQKLYRLEAYPILKIHEDEKTGILDLPNGLHKVDIIAHDAAQNESTLSFYVNVEKPKKSKRVSKLKLKDYPIINTNVDYDIIVLEKGIVFQINTEVNNSEIISVYIEMADKLLTFPLQYKNEKYLSEFIGFDKLQGIRKVGFLFYADSTYKFESDIKPQLILPNKNSTVFSNDSTISINIIESFYDTTLAWIENHSILSKSYNKTRRSEVYEIFSKGIPFKNKIEVSFELDDIEKLNNSAIYKYSPKKSKWNYVKSEIDSNKITAKLSKPEIITVIDDIKRPWFNYAYPKDSASYTQGTLANIKIMLDDDLSGINSSEKYLQVHLDGKRLLVAYQPIKKEISYDIRNPLSIGEHNLKINIQDRSGNLASKSIKFFIE